jgi:hypothetical protein
MPGCVLTLVYSEGMASWLSFMVRPHKDGTTITQCHQHLFGVFRIHIMQQWFQISVGICVKTHSSSCWDRFRFGLSVQSMRHILISRAEVASSVTLPANVLSLPSHCCRELRQCRGGHDVVLGEDGPSIKSAVKPITSVTLPSEAADAK